MAGVPNTVHALLHEMRGVAVAKVHEASSHKPQSGGVIFFYFAGVGVINFCNVELTVATLRMTDPASRCSQINGLSADLQPI